MQTKRHNAKRQAVSGYAVFGIDPAKAKHHGVILSGDGIQPGKSFSFAVSREGFDKIWEPINHVFDPDLEAMHQLSICYDKLGKDRVKAKLRLRSLMEKYFPEYLNAFDISTKTSLHLLAHYFLPRHFLELDISQEAPRLLKLSQGYHGRETLEDLKVWAKTSIGVPADPVVEEALRIVLDGWIRHLSLIEEQIKDILKSLKTPAKKLPEFDILTSIPNISDNLAALFIAETANPSRFDHYKQVEKLAGLNLRLSQSGQYSGQRRISGIGNNRLRHIIYQILFFDILNKSIYPAPY